VDVLVSTTGLALVVLCGRYLWRLAHRPVDRVEAFGAPPTTVRLAGFGLAAGVVLFAVPLVSYLLTHA
jgi:hypothetical protein